MDARPEAEGGGEVAEGDDGQAVLVCAVLLVEAHEEAHQNLQLPAHPQVVAFSCTLARICAYACISIHNVIT